MKKNITRILINKRLEKSISLYSNVDEYKTLLNILDELNYYELYDREFTTGYNVKTYFHLHIKRYCLKNNSHLSFGNELQDFLYNLVEFLKECIIENLSYNMKLYDSDKIYQYVEYIDKLKEIEYTDINEFLNCKYELQRYYNYDFCKVYKIKYVDKEKNNKIAKIENDIKVLAYELKIMLNELQELKNS